MMCQESPQTASIPVLTTNSINMPNAEPNGFVKTLNNMGYMTSTLDSFSQAFVEFAAKGPGPSLDVGAAYGVATLAALEKGASVIANDLDSRHLEILKSRVPLAKQNQLQLLPGAFPGALEIPSNTLGSILICRVLHFFSGPMLEKAAECLFSWLAPEGKIFLVSETPYLRNFQKFIPVYEKRKEANDPWPGFIADVMSVAPERGLSLPPQMHLLDPEVLSRVFENAGFTIERVNTFARPDFPRDIQLDGRESVGLIAKKA